MLCCSGQDDSPVSLEIAEASSQDQGMYYCCLSNMYGKVTAEFHLTAAGKLQFRVWINNNDNDSFHSEFFYYKILFIFFASS